jgi:hypothetical protein
MPTHIAVIALLLFPFPWRHDDANVVRHLSGGWTLRLHRDHFAQRLACQLSKHRITYERGALVFHLSPDIDTSSAVYRVDGGPPMDVRLDQGRLARLGFALENDDLANPSGGLVRIPEDRVVGAYAVAIELKADSRPRTFAIAGFDAALASARAAACAPEDFH